MLGGGSTLGRRVDGLDVQVPKTEERKRTRRRRVLLYTIAGVAVLGFVTIGVVLPLIWDRSGGEIIDENLSHT